MNYNIQPFDGTGVKSFNLDTEGRLYYLPENFQEVQDPTQFIYPESSTDIRKAFIKSDIAIQYLTEARPLLRARKSADWVGPTVFIGISFLAENSNLLNISLNLISNYLYDFFKGKRANKKVKFSLVIENKKKEEYQKLDYEGPVDGIKDLEPVIKQLKK